MAKKTYVLDTNVILADTNCFYSFKNNDILVPLKVLQELDKHKKSEILGFSARNSIKFIDALREKGSILEGVRIGKGYGLFSVASAGEVELPKEFPASDPDNQILATALSYAKNNPEIKVILVSNDINLRIKCDAVGLACESFTEDHVIKHQGELFSGVKEIRVDEQIIERFYSGESLVPVDILDNTLSIFPNEFLILVSSANEKKSCLARFMTWQTPLRKLGSHKNDWGLVPKNKEQEFTANLLLDPDVHLVTMVGKAGTGKTLITLGYGLEQLDATKKKGAGSASGPNKRYKRLIVSRPVVPMGKDIGFLPGSLQEKMSPWLAPVQDNLRTLMGNDEMMLEEYSNQKLIEVEALTYIRGRSIPNSYIIIDECFPGDQYVLGPNGTKHQIYDLFVETKRTGKYPKIMSYDTETHQYETDEIVSITRKELPRQLLEVQIGGFSFYPTDEHPFLSLERGWIHAKDLRVGEAVCSYGENRLSYKILSDDQEQLVYGCLLDPKFSLEQLGKTKFSISAKFNKDHESFYEPFLDVIGGNIKTLMETEKVEYFSFINNKKKLSDVRKFTSEHFYSTDVNYQGKGTHREKILELIDVRGWAVFYQNCIYNHEEHGPVFEVDYHHGPQIVNKFSSLGFECELINNTTIRFVGKSFNDFAEWVAPYFFKENVKLLPKKPPHVIAWDTKDTGRFVSLVESVEPSARKEIVYDIEVEKNHNFVVCSKYVDNFGIVVHNCQNLTRHEVKTILTRVGENSKIVLIGDIEQIDNVNLDETNNGLTYAIEKFKEETIAGHTTLTKGERSLLATRASKIL